MGDSSDFGSPFLTAPASAEREISPEGSTEEHTPRRRGLRFPPFWHKFSRIGKTLHHLFHYGSLLSSFVASLLLVLPKISISSTISANLENPTGTQFSIVNEGYVPVFGMFFKCENVNTSGEKPISGVVLKASPKPVSLWPGQTATRGCSDIDPRVSSIALDGAAHYNWFSIYHTKTVVHFSGVRSGKDFYLVPDVP